MSASVVIRTDASSRIGTGHLMRCLTLAEALRDKGMTVRFVSRLHDGNLCDLIEQLGFTVSCLAAPSGAASKAHASWLGATWEEDAIETLDAVRASGGAPGWLVIDHYAIDARWEQRLRPHVGRILAIDDLADREHDCDVLLDQNLVPGLQGRYRGKVPGHCVTLLGPRYAMLQALYAQLHERVPPRSGAIKRIFVFFGGGDTADLSVLALRAFLELGRNDIRVDVIAKSALVDAVARGHRNITAHCDLPSLALLMAKADLAIGACGATSWERLCLGLPAVVTAIAENQIPIREGLVGKGVARWMGDRTELTEQGLQDALAALLKEGLDATWSRRCHDVVDGKGVGRVVAAMTLTGRSELIARYATPKDEELMVEWNSENTAVRKTFVDELRDVEGVRSYMLENADGVAVGGVAFSNKGGKWTLESRPGKVCGGEAIQAAMLGAAVCKLRSEETGALTFSPRARANGSLKISLCSDEGSWFNSHLFTMIVEWLDDGHEVTWVHNADHLPGGDLCFYLSYGRIVGRAALDLYEHNLVVHASDLPRGRGWSPMTWKIIEGASEIPMTLLEAGEAVDSGVIYGQVTMQLAGDELIDELREMQASVTFKLCHDFVTGYPGTASTARPQDGTPTYYSRRRPKDSQLDPDKPLREQFNLLRVADNSRYPAWFEAFGRIYYLRVTGTRKKDAGTQ